MLEIVGKLESKLKAIDDQMALPEVLSNQKRLISLTRERRQVESILETALKYRQAHAAVDEANQIVASSDDEELVAMAKEELESGVLSLEQLEQELKLKLLPQDPNDDKSAVVEIRAGTGGDEAGLFAADLFRMYQRFADKSNWKIEVMNSHASEVGGFKEIIFSISGDLVFGRMKYESGVHRVQRVPVTETQGRI
ncbi:MAG: PCRF domain-containing protein, partial [candidate division Zixibacteria bacterium]|nr:PCRF domain-containing protein [candidate division Zixibacteria bacterium]